MADQPDTSPPELDEPARPHARRRVALAMRLDELHEALTIAGYRTAEGSHLVTLVHRPELDQVHVIVEGPAYPLIEPGCEPPRFRAADVRAGLRVVAEAAAAAVDMQLVPKPRAAELPADRPPLEGDGGIGVGMAVST